MSEGHDGLGFVGTAFESARQTLLRLRRWRVWWVVAFAAVVLCVVAGLLANKAERIDGRFLVSILSWWMVGTVLLPWFAMWLGVQTVYGSLEDRTFQYLFLRPVSRTALLFGNWLAVTLVAAAVGVLGMAAVFAGVAPVAERWPVGVETGVFTAFAAAAVAGAVAYAAAAMAFATATRRPLLWAALFVVGLQMFVANLPMSAGLRQLTITDPLRRLLVDRLEPDRRLVEALWPAQDVLEDAAIGEPMRDLVVFTCVCLVFAALRYCRTEYDARPRE